MDAKNYIDAYHGKTVLVTGHTGFKGSWLVHALTRFGAHVVGVGLAPRTARDIFVQTDVRALVREHHEFDIRDAERVRALVAQVCPDVIFHLAAQPLVRLSYDEPHATISTNVMGTMNVLEAVRETPVSAVVVITTDKVYENKEVLTGYRESDPLGGHDPYSGSKAAADLLTQSYIRSYFNPERFGGRHKTLVGIARAGNVIGGGDWSPDRLVPDIMRAVLHGGGIVRVRNPGAVRPWEHVLEPVSGYLTLGARLLRGDRECSGAWNFGPREESWVSVKDVVENVGNLLRSHGFSNTQVYAASDSSDGKHEANLLMLNVEKAHERLLWQSRWNVDATLGQTVLWYVASRVDGPQGASSVTQSQLQHYFSSPFSQ